MSSAGCIRRVTLRQIPIWLLRKPGPDELFGRDDSRDPPRRHSHRSPACPVTSWAIEDFPVAGSKVSSTTEP